MYNTPTSINKNEYTSNNAFLGWFAYNDQNKQGYCYEKAKTNKGWIDQNNCNYYY